MIKTMVSWSAVFGVFVVSLAMVLTPGPNMMYLVSRSITQGRRAGAFSLAGIATGVLVYMTATNLGIAVVFLAVPTLYVALKIAGACYLGWLAFKTLRPGGVSVFAPAPMPLDRPRRLYTMGLLTSLLNPKMAILYLSLIPQFIEPSRGNIMIQGFLLGGTQMVTGMTVNLLIVLAAGTIAVFLARRPTWLRVQRYVMGTVLGGLAVRMATDQARPVAVG